MQIEKLILRNLLSSDSYTRKVLPFIKSDYFHDLSDKTIFNIIHDFVIKYNKLPTSEILSMEVNSMDGLTEKTVSEINQSITEFGAKIEPPNEQWLIDNTEQFCQDKALYNAIMKSIDIMKSENSGAMSKGNIPTLLSNALSVSFDPNVGHNYIEDYLDRYEYYHKVEEKIPFDLTFFNAITKNGVSHGTLNIVMSSTGGGKSLFMCHHAATCLHQGRNVLYITLELAEEEVAKRIDANLMNMAIDDLLVLSKDAYTKRLESIKSKTNGKLIIKQYPTASASTINFKSLLNELDLKKNFKPDIIFVDYLNICCSARVKPGNNVNSYTYVKSIAEELRGLAVEYDVPIFSATQVNRTGHVSSDVGLEDTSESFGLPATADFMFALISTEELEALGQIMVKQLKNRYASIEKNKRFIIGIDRGKMKLFDCEPSAQKGIVDSGQSTPVFENTKFQSTADRFKKLKVE